MRDCRECEQIMRADYHEFIYVWAPDKSEEFWRSIGEMGRGIALARHQREREITSHNESRSEG